MSHCSWQQPQEGHPHLADKGGKPQGVSRGQEGAFVGAQPFPQAWGLPEGREGTLWEMKILETWLPGLEFPEMLLF